MMHAIPHPGPDVAKTMTLPGKFYTDDKIFAHEREQIFFKNWRYVCHASALSKPGAYVTATVFDQEIFVVRGQDGDVRAFYNVCPHRGHKLVEGSGERKLITCPYHAWSYDLTGSLVRAREKPGNQRFVDSRICLSAIRVDKILDFIFINLDPAAVSLAEYTKGLEDHINAVLPDLSSYKMRQNVEYFGGAYECNWKVAIDNFLECYHCETAHKSFSDMMDVANSTFRFAGNYIYQFVPSGGKDKSAAYDIDLEQDAVDGHFWFLFPNIIFSVFPGTKNFSVSWLDPVSPTQSMRCFETMTPDGISLEREAARSKWGLEVLNEEDRRLCRSVQRGMNQRGFDKGYYLVDPANGNLSEETVRYFHQLYLNQLFACDDGIGN